MNEKGKCPNCGEWVTESELADTIFAFGCVHCIEDLEKNEESILYAESLKPEWEQRF